jgi:hypothetical protein
MTRYEHRVMSQKTEESVFHTHLSITLFQIETQVQELLRKPSQMIRAPEALVYQERAIPGQVMLGKICLRLRIILQPHEYIPMDAWKR